MNYIYCLIVTHDINVADKFVSGIEVFASDIFITFVLSIVLGTVILSIIHMAKCLRN